MYVGDVCTDSVITVEPTQTLRQAAARMRQFHVGDLIVLDDDTDLKRPIGIITDRDLVMTALAQNAEDLRVRDVMRGELVVARDQDTVSDVIQIMLEHRVRRVPVVDDNDNLVGVFTTDDALGLLAEQMSALAQLVLSQPAQEEQIRPSQSARRM
jgi:CBS domain-containing protein